MTISKQYARRALDDTLPVYDDPFVYRSVTEHDNVELLRILAAATSDSRSRDIGGDAAVAWRELVEFADTAFAPEHWMIAYRDDAPAGLVFPQRYYDKPSEGSLFLIAVLPAHRGNGYAKILHAKGLALLRSIGVEQYVGSTDVDNAAMVAVFIANGCRLTAVREIALDDDPVGPS